MFLKISQNSQENTRVIESSLLKRLTFYAQKFSCEFCEISKNSFSYRAPTVAASEQKEQTLCYFANHKRLQNFM